MPFDVIQTHYALAQLMRTRERWMMPSSNGRRRTRLPTTDIPAGVPQLTEVLGVAYFHKSETENDAYRAAGRPLPFPAAKELLLQADGGLGKSDRISHKILGIEARTAGSVQVKWLLNLA